MEVKQITTKSMPYDAWKDNEYIEKLVQELRDSGTNVLVGSLDKLINWGRSNSLWPLTFATSCCGIEFVSLGAARFDMARFGWEVARSSPRQADFIMVAGTIVNRMAPVFRRLYDQLAEPKYVIACGSCAISGGPFRKSYHVAKGIEDIVPVDVFCPGCPPPPRGHDILHHAALAQGEGGALLRRRQPPAEACRLLCRASRAGSTLQSGAL